MDARLLTMAVPAAVTNSIALSQTPGAAGNLTLNGALVTAAVANLVATNCQQRRVSVTTAGAETAIVTITGTQINSNGRSVVVSENIQLAGAATYNSVLDYATITQIAVNGALGAAITAGTIAVSSSPWIRVQADRTQPMQIGFGVKVTGTVNYSCELSWGPFLDAGIAAPASTPDVFQHSSVTQAVADQTGNIAFFVGAFRFTLNSGTGSIRVGFGQSGLSGN